MSLRRATPSRPRIPLPSMSRLERSGTAWVVRLVIPIYASLRVKYLIGVVSWNPRNIPVFCPLPVRKVST